MKKLFIVLAIASLGFAACNNSSEKKEGDNKDTTAMQTQPSNMDTASQTMPTTDTSAMKK